jgi:hypothetical protein
MKGAATFAAIAAIVVILIVALASAFTVEQTERKEATDRVLLPTRRLHDGGDRCSLGL